MLDLLTHPLYIVGGVIYALSLLGACAVGIMEYSINGTREDARLLLAILAALVLTPLWPAVAAVYAVFGVWSLVNVARGPA